MCFNVYIQTVRNNIYCTIVTFEICAYFQIFLMLSVKISAIAYL